MKNIFSITAIVVLALTLTAGPISAFQHNLTIQATVASACTTVSPSGSGFTVSGNNSTFAVQADNSGTTPGSGTLSFGVLNCNTGKTNVSLSSLKKGLYVAASPSGLDPYINYIATAKLGSSQIAQLTTANGGNSVSSGAQTIGGNALTVVISFPSLPSDYIKNGPLVSGIYTDILTIDIVAAT
jgi:hypothetical protein